MLENIFEVLQTIWEFLGWILFGCDGGVGPVLSFTILELTLLAGYRELAGGLQFGARRNTNKHIGLGWDDLSSILGDWNTMLANWVLNNYPPDSYYVASINRMAIKRSAMGYPETLAHGDLIYDSDVSGMLYSVEDENPVPDAVNYYTLFIEVKLDHELKPDLPEVEYVWLNWFEIFVKMVPFPVIPADDYIFYTETLDLT